MNRTAMERKKHLIDVAAGRKPADVVLKNASYVNVLSGEVLQGDIAICGDVIAGIGTYSGTEERDMSGLMVCPGFMDAHIHLESSLVRPAEFAAAVVPHGTTMVITDPHEIANVMGADGIDFMLQSTEKLPLEVRFVLPSCVPATPYEEAGAVLDGADLKPLYTNERVIGLAEMMNAFGVVHQDETVLQKLIDAEAEGSPIDGHAPGLTGRELCAYAAAGINSDHECATEEEGLEKLRMGQYIMIREGTAARNLAGLAGLLRGPYARRCVFCTDDKHPSDLLELGHMDYILRQAVTEHGVDPILAVQAATINVAEAFGLRRRGAIAPGWPADLTVVEDLRDFRVRQVWCKGRLQAEDGVMKPFEEAKPDPRLLERALHTFHVQPITAESFRTDRPLGVIGMVDGQIVTTDEAMADGVDLEKDILKIAVIERHKGTGHVGLGYLKGYGLKQGAVATSISHDSHNLIVVGTSDEEMAFAANRIIDLNGGICVVDDGRLTGRVPLNIGGLMSTLALSAINDALERAKKQAHAQGVNRGIDPFMTLSFMSLPVIPTLRLTTKGVFDVDNQKFI